MNNAPTLSLNNEEMSYTHITPSQQNELSVLLRTKTTQKEIAHLLHKDRTTIWRERKRNGDEEGNYHARKAKEKTKERQVEAHTKQRKIENSSWLKTYIEKKLRVRWSPEQIAGHLKKTYSHNKKKQIGKDSIYLHIYEERKDLIPFLRCKKGKYRRRYGTRTRGKTRDEAKKKRIDIRPKIVEVRKRMGDWEGDTIVGSDKNHILTHVERKSGMLFADKLATPTAEETHRATVRRFKTIPRKKRHTITYDNGTTFSQYEMTEKKIAVTIYFAHPYHSWERGCNENANGLLREYFPKRTPLGSITQKEIDKAVREINNRPRKRLGFIAPSKVFYGK